VKLYKQYIRPHLEFAVPAWSSWLENEKQQLEAVQMKAVNWVTGLRAGSYAEKCNELGLLSLEARRWEQDMVQTFKILRGYGNIDENRFFERMDDRQNNRTRLAAGTDNLKLPRVRTDVKKNAFSVRVIRSWNSLPDTIKSSGSVLAFKNGIKSFIENGGRPGYV
jgi:hypothetical protein